MQMPGPRRPQRPARWLADACDDVFDRQALHFGTTAVAADAGGAGVDHIADTRNGERCLGDVRGDDDAAPGSTLRSGSLEDPVLFGRRQSGVEREHLGVAKFEIGQRVGGIADLAFAATENEDVAGRLVVEFEHGVADSLGLAQHPAPSLSSRAVPDLDGEGSARDLDDRGVVEVFGESLSVDRGRRDDDLEVGTFGKQLFEVAEQEVDVEAALVGFVDDDHRVGREQSVVLHLGQQHPVGHQLDGGALRHVVGEPHLVADELPTSVPSSWETRSAIDRAAIRLGWVWPIQPCSASPSSRHIFGSWVLFPEPVSPATITTWLSRIASRSSVFRSEIGSSGGYVTDVGEVRLTPTC